MLDDLTKKRKNRALMQMVVSAFSAVLTSFPLLSEDLKTVSTDYCADQFVLALADKSQIKAVSKEALDAHSFHRDRARYVPTFGGSAEEILMQESDTVVWSWRGGANVNKLFARTGTTAVQVDYALSADDVFRNVSKIAGALGKVAEGEVMITDYKARLLTLKGMPKTKLKAVYVTQGGFTAGLGTFVDNVIKLSGFDTVADEMKINSWQPVPLEALVLNPPDVIIGSFFDLTTSAKSQWGLTRHPLLNKMMQEIPTILVPSKYLSCNGFFFVDGAEYIREEASKLGLFPPYRAPKPERDDWAGQ
ncbi:ABC transporter substrate-binding protein [Kordiimonas sp. SCSIO 12610]|uniref:ABC transporter substrate-binding protein n=1 Tax=Kordiimonas sp. SCSIO 12610 TaxID=2829597 RepID=UPI00210C7581|nr:ABC transporter substrate-binding protein [Kordiimonas sp. SCSIO 12610]UTW55928.1 ABC transporter substrate-binding protein [Kordiimonas sp. SCSIO 12610]